MRKGSPLPKDGLETFRGGDLWHHIEVGLFGDEVE